MTKLKTKNRRSVRFFRKGVERFFEFHLKKSVKGNGEIKIIQYLNKKKNELLKGRWVFN